MRIDPTVVATAEGADSGDQSAELVVDKQGVPHASDDIALAFGS